MNLNANIYHVAEALENASEGDTVHVWNIDCVMRGISNDEMDERNISRDYIDNHICQLKVENSTITLNFHEHIQEEDIVFGPSEPHGTDPKELNDTLCIILQQVDYAYDIIEWELASINAASMGYDGYLADYEFSYEALV